MSKAKDVAPADFMNTFLDSLVEWCDVSISTKTADMDIYIRPGGMDVRIRKKSKAKAKRK